MTHVVTFGFLTPTTAIILVIIILIIFGPGKLPELGRSLGKGIREFRSATNDVNPPYIASRILLCEGQIVFLKWVSDKRTLLYRVIGKYQSK